MSGASAVSVKILEGICGNDDLSEGSPDLEQSQTREPRRVQMVLRPLRHLVAYGSTNKYRPVSRSNASRATAMRPNRLVYFPLTTATPLMMTATVKTIDSQRWVCRTHLFQFNRTSSRLLSRFRPVGARNAELFSVLGGQSLPSLDFHGLATRHAADGRTVEQAIQNVETDMPARGAPRDEAAIDAVPQRQTRTLTQGFKFPPDIAVLQHLGSVGSRHSFRSPRRFLPR